MTSDLFQFVDWLVATAIQPMPAEITGLLPVILYSEGEVSEPVDVSMETCVRIACSVQEPFAEVQFCVAR